MKRSSSDIYAVGIVAIQALTGTKDPSQLTEDPTTGELFWSAPAKTDPTLVKLLNQMVRANFAQRFVSAGVALKAVQALSSPPIPPTVPHQHQLQAPPPSPPKPAPPVPAKTPAQPQRLISPTPNLQISSPPTARWPRRAFLLGGLALGGAIVLPRLPRWLAALTSDPSPSPSLPPSLDPSPSLQPPTSPSASPTPSPEPSPEPSPPPKLPGETQRFEIVRVNDRGEVVDRQARQGQRWTEDLGNGVTLDLMQVPAGSFMMGTSDSERNTVIKEATRYK